MAGNNNVIEKRLWDAADDLRANSKLKSYEYSLPVLGLIFLKHADYIFTKAAKEIEGQGTGRRTPGKPDYQARGSLYLPGIARYSHLMKLPESSDESYHGRIFEAACSSDGMFFQGTYQWRASGKYITCINLTKCLSIVSSAS